MKAFLYNKKHLPSKLVLSEIKKPVPADDQVLVKIISVSINAADYRSMKMGIIPKSKIFGGAIAGEIESIGKQIKKFKIGDEIIADLSDFGFGGFAEYVLAPEKALVHKPSNISFEAASTLPIASTTALKAIRDKGGIKNNQTVLIVGGSGGVGIFTIQIAKYYKATITAVCSSNNLEQAIDLGAHKVIDYTKQNFTKLNEKYDLIIAINGNYPLLSYKKCLNRDGTYVMVGGSLKQIFKSIFFGWLLSLGSKKMKYLSAKSDKQDLEFVAGLMNKGILDPRIAKKYTFKQIPEAMLEAIKGSCSGKITISIDQD